MHFLNSVLASVWTVLAALVGSCGALLVGTASLVHSRKQLRLQMEQQAQQQKIGREMNLRRDVYLEAAVAIARATSSLNELAEVGSGMQELARQYAADFATIAKVHIVGSPETIEALMRVTRELGNAQAELNAARIPMLERQQRMDAGHETGEELAVLRREHTEARLQIAELAMGWMAKVAQQVPQAVVAIRKELDLPPHAEFYRETFERNWQHSQQHLRRTIEKIRAETGHGA
jgi:hypothetical protein